MDRCKCWGTTQVTITIEHCPSANKEIALELDYVVDFIGRETSLKRFGKTVMGVATYTPANKE